ncbi:hypothetical protein E0Z10_g1113 [Xylaria hypoxylon]|uniref:Glutaredoxin domain-containing protein n=1 Tax=Xylaria hypoxylon TaxID=37992 RepID=A0A4Z0ZDH8_9PEZI|nr:hypothetical protein E0Z10_g1113 [Xylaria hypoxylon]
MVTVLAVVVTILFFTSKVRHSTPRDPRTINSFFGKTVNGLDERHGTSGQIVMSGKGSSTNENLKDHDGDGSVDEDDKILAQEMGERLRAAEQQAKEQANAKAPLKPDSPSDVVDAEDEKEDDEDSEVEVALQQILERSPVVIFSKTYCPYSKKAKGILLEKYIIEPAPYIVELNEHPLGAKLQTLLAEKTGRKTVPNIMIHGKSVGGSDEIAGLDTRKTLIDKFKSVGGKKISMKERFTGNAKDKAS